MRGRHEAVRGKHEAPSSTAGRNSTAPSVKEASEQTKEPTNTLREASSGKKQNFMHGAAILTVGLVIMKLLGAIYKVPLGNILGDYGYGIFLATYNVYNIFFTLSTAGLPVALSRLIAEADARGQESLKEKTFRAAIVTFAAIGMVFSLIMFFGNQWLATAFIPHKGFTFAVCDFSAIEARVLAWLAGEEWVLDVFRHGGDIYCSTASKMFHKPVEKHGMNSDLRPKGKVAVLALGYGGGVSALDKMGGQRLGMTEQEEKDTVAKWRSANPRIVAFWHDVEDAALKVIQGLQKTARLGIRKPITEEERQARMAMAGRQVRDYSVRDSYLEFSMHEGWLLCRLPSGRCITWPEAQVTINRFGGQAIRYKGVNQKTNKWGWLETFGGKLVENITQAVARDCLAHVLLQLSHEPHIRVVFHVHDEVVCEVLGEDALARLEDYFSHGPEWAEGLPLQGAGYTGPFYYKD